MDDQKTRTRNLAFLVSGLVDLLLGGLLLLAWFGLLPIDLAGLGISQAAIGLLGAFLSVTGVVMIAWQVGRIGEPGE